MQYEDFFKKEEGLINLEELVNNNTEDVEGDFERTFICKIDQQNASLDYLDGVVGIRLEGFSVDSFVENQESTIMYTFDFTQEEFYKFEHVEKFVEDFFNDTENNFAVIRIQNNSNAPNYYYKSFSNEEPVNFSFESIWFNNRDYGTKLRDKNQAYNNFLNLNTQKQISHVNYFIDSKYELKVYNVGQGMSSLLHNDSFGILLDIGAGKPITRKNYSSGSINNELKNDIKNLKSLVLILSHLDSDHYRVINWDDSILNKISKVFIPYGVNWFSGRDEKLNKTLEIIEVKQINLSFQNFSLSTYRTDFTNKISSKNDEELVSHLICENKKNILFPGDYCYENFNKDNNLNIKNLSVLNYDFIVVPHHGDEKSKNFIFNPQFDDSKAFFSAGTHTGYGHPNKDSEDNHKSKGFQTINVKTKRDIGYVAQY